VVSCNRTATRLMIVATPNQSANWHDNLRLMLLLSIPVLFIATGFALHGIWFILPFAGLELLALGAALYHVSRKLQYRHVITVTENSVDVDKGYDCPLQHWHFARDSAGLTITTEQHPADAPSLRMHDRHESVTLGEFLNREDSLELLELLRQEIRVRSHSATTRRAF
jgi:uncharacterized membrane protein